MELTTTLGNGALFAAHPHENAQAQSPRQFWHLPLDRINWTTSSFLIGTLAMTPTVVPGISGILAWIHFRWRFSSSCSWPPASVTEIMDSLAQKQVASVIRVIRDPGKDIALSMLAQFRYGAELPVSTVEIAKQVA
jgi:hypothetical protein